MLLVLLISGVTASANCYVSIDTTTPYVVSERTVRTQQECEMLCDYKIECSGFAYKANALPYPCVILSSVIPNKMCAAKTTIFVKQGCGETTIAPTTDSTTLSTTTQERRLIGIVEVVDPAPLSLYIYNEKLDVSEDPQWNTARFIKISVLSTGGCTITVTDEKGSVTETLTTSASSPKTAVVSKIKEVFGVCTSSDFSETLKS